jgi:hypothetical protein
MVIQLPHIGSLRLTKYFIIENIIKVLIYGDQIYRHDNAYLLNKYAQLYKTHQVMEF